MRKVFSGGVILSKKDTGKEVNKIKKNIIRINNSNYLLKTLGDNNYIRFITNLKEDETFYFYKTSKRFNNIKWADLITKILGSLDVEISNKIKKVEPGDSIFDLWEELSELYNLDGKTITNLIGNYLNDGKIPEFKLKKVE